MYNVLIADDEQAVCEGLRTIIDWNGCGFQIPDTVRDGEEALARLKSREYHLIITDIRMPVLNGLELIEKIRTQNPKIKILILSGYSDFEYARKAIEFHVKGYLLKPVDRDELLQRLRSLKDELDMDEQSNIQYGDKSVFDLYWNSSRLLSYLEEFDTDGMEREIDVLVQEVKNKHFTVEMTRVVSYNLMFEITAVIKKYDKSISLFQQEITYTKNNNFEVEQFRRLLISICRQARDVLLELQRSKHPNITDRIKKYVEQHYADDLNLQSVSNMFFINPVYLGRVFKNSTGDTFSDYLNKVRIAEMKKKLVSNDSKISEIIKALGYNNQEYFYRVFRKYEGVSFAEYKEALRQKIGR